MKDYEIFYSQKVLESINTDFVLMGIALGLIGGYAIASIIFLKFPTILHMKKKPKFRALHISHRGGAGEYPENTLKAFEHALASRTQMLELDVQLTADRQVVVSHDNNLQRLTGQDILVSDTSYQDLPCLKQHLNVDFQPGTSCACDCSDDDRRIPLLKDVFEKFPSTPINLDIKTYNESLMQAVQDLIRQYHREDITVWGNVNVKVCEQLYKMDPGIPLLASARKTFLLNLCFYTGLLPFIPIKESYYEIIMPSIALKKFPSMAKKYRYILKVADFLLMNRVMFHHLQKRGIQVFVWVLNDDAEFDRAFSYDVDGIMTDYPTKLTQYLQEKNDKGLLRDHLHT